MALRHPREALSACRADVFSGPPAADNAGRIQDALPEPRPALDHDSWQRAFGCYVHVFLELRDSSAHVSENADDVIVGWVCAIFVRRELAQFVSLRIVSIGLFKVCPYV